VDRRYEGLDKSFSGGVCAASQLPNHGEQLCRMTGHNPPDITPSSEPPVRAVLNQGVMSGGLHPPILKFSFQNPISCNRKRHRILCSNSTGGLVMSRQFRPALPLMGGSHPWGLCPGRFMSANRCVVVSGGPPTFSSEDGLKPGFHYPSSRLELTARVRPSTRVHFLTPVNSGSQLGCQKMHPSSRAINSACELRP